MTEPAHNLTAVVEPAGPQVISFDFAGYTWDLIEDFNILDFQEFLEAQRIIAAFRYALGEQYDQFKASAGASAELLQEATEALVAAVGLGSPGNSRASRRSSGPRRTARP